MYEHSKIGLFGKTPSQRDFLRVNIGTPVVAAFDEWLRESVMTLPSLRARLPQEPLPFVFRAPAELGFLIGVMIGSRDGVGREFPLAVFLELDGRAHARDWPALPAAYARFLAAAAELLGRVDGLDASQLPGLLTTLPRPSAAEIEASGERGRRQLQQISADELLDRLFARPTGNPEGERWSDDHLFGIGTALHGCYRVAGQPPRSGTGSGAGAITLDCPVSSDTEQLFWLELARRSIAWPSPPSFLWSQQQYRMLLVLGSPGPAVLGLLGTPNTVDRDLWPLVVDDEELVAQAAQLLTVEQRAMIERPGQTGAELLDSIAPPR